MAKAKPKKKAVRKAKRTSSGPTTLAGLESRIRQVDRHLAKSLNERAQLRLKWAKLRKESGQPTAPLGQDEEDAIQRVLQYNKGPLPDRCVRTVFRELLSGCEALLKELRVAFLGPEYSYSHLAALHRFGQSVQFAPVDSIAAVFEEVNRGHCDYGIVPIENSTDGRVADTLDMFTRLPVRICGEVELEIHHALLGKCSRNEIREVFSKPQALSQCRNWLAKHLPTARTIEVTSTSTAARLAGEKPGAAAIASLQAGVHYGLDVVAERIEDNPTNTTRFTIIGEHSAARTGNDRTAMMFQVEHQPGALADALAIFKRNRLNLTWIESFPIPGSERAYLFFAEMEGHETDARVRRATEALERKTLRLEVLGSCPVVPAAE